MLKKRVITFLTFKTEGEHSVLFRTKKYVPDYRYTSAFLGCESVDEIIAVDLSADEKGPSDPFLRNIERIAENWFVPLTVGGRLSTVDQIRRCLNAGADKCIFGRRARDYGRLTALSRKFGSQLLVGAVEYTDDQQIDEIREQARLLDRAGCGEIAFCNISRDGSLLGYGKRACSEINKGLTRPCIVAGGCGTWQHMKEAFDAGADACATTNIFHFTEESMRRCKAYLRAEGVAVR